MHSGSHGKPEHLRIWSQPHYSLSPWYLAEILSALLRQRGACAVSWLWRPSTARTLKTRAYHGVGRPPIIHMVLLERSLEKSSHTSWPSDSSGRNTVWNFTSSVFMTVGDADTHPGRLSPFEPHVGRQRIHVHASVLDLSDFLQD